MLQIALAGPQLAGYFMRLALQANYESCVDGDSLLLAFTSQVGGNVLLGRGH